VCRRPCQPGLTVTGVCTGDGTASIISPNTASTKTRLLGHLPDAAERLTSMTISFYPLATKHDLRLLLAVAALKSRCRQPDASGGELASMASLCRQDKNYAEAVAYYRRALASDYGQVRWRLGLAQALAETGQVSEAMQEARICLRLRPQMTAARSLIEKLSVLPAARGSSPRAARSANTGVLKLVGESTSMH